MSFWKIAWRNIEQRALASSLTALSMALGVAAMIAVMVIHSVTVRQFSPDAQAQGYNLIVGGKGGELQLVLSTVYYMGQPLYPIPYSYYKKFVDGEFSDRTKVAIPECLGDSYVLPDGTMFRVVATIPDLFDKINYGNFDDGTPKRYEFQPGGRNFADATKLRGEEFETAAFEAVIGSVVAARSGLKVGDKINPTHGMGAEGHHHDDAFTIVGILKPTGTANDWAVFINLEGFYLMEGHSLSPHDEAAHSDEHPDEHAGEHADHELDAKHADHEHADHEHDEAAEHAHDEHADHDHTDSHAHEHEHEHHEPLPESQREVTSILVLCGELESLSLDMEINKGEGRIAQAVAPGRVVTRLIDNFVGPTRIVLMALTILIILVAGIGILVSIYNSMSERGHDIAVMRALGASRGAVMMIILAESILLAVGGGLIGILLGHGLIGLASPFVVERTGVTLGWFDFDWRELVLIPALLILASLVGLLPALTAYRTDVAKALAGSR